jgi:helicase
MKIQDAAKYIPTEVYEKIKGKITEFMPPQEEAIKKGLFKGENMVVSSPTASGKTLIAEMAILNSLSQKKKAIYVAPMRALISEKFDDFKKDYPDIKAALSMGDYNEKDSNLSSYDVIFVSTEKLDSLLRHPNNSYLGNIGCIIYDEIHLLLDSERGPTLEFLITLNKKIFASAQIIGLSATISNGEDIARWLGGKLVKSDFRPVKLLKKIYFEGELINGKKEEINNVEDPLINLVIDLIKRQKQALVFSQTKKSTISNAKLIANVVGPKLTYEEKKGLNKLAGNILSVLERPTSQCEEISNLVKNGVAFHHAGLVNKQRKLIEEGFRAGLIKFIVATPTLAMGVNLPANTVIISSVYRYGVYGSEPLPALEIEQMLGRAGRPKYDKEGTAIVIARNNRDLEFIKNKYFEGELEPIVSRFNNEIAIRRYTLALVDLGFYGSRKAVLAFFKGLFINHFDVDITDKIEDAIDFLLEHSFVSEEGGKLETTRLGKLINALYLDPYTGIIFIKFIEKTKEKGEMDVFSVLHLLFCTEEFKFIRISQSEFQKYEEESYGLNLLADQNLIEYERFISAIKMAHIVNDWLEEKSEKELEEEYKVLPGEFYVTLEALRWLVYALKELSRALGGKSNELMKIATRIRYGIKEELLPLVSIPEIGRVRARRLYSYGFKTISGLKAAEMSRLSQILGSKIAEKVYYYLHDKEVQRKLI